MTRKVTWDRGRGRGRGRDARAGMLGGVAGEAGVGRGEGASIRAAAAALPACEADEVAYHR